VGGILLRFRRYALVKELAGRFVSSLDDDTASFGSATAEEKRRAIIFYGSWRFMMDWKPVDRV
jgi:hypothetical protein